MRDPGNEVDLLAELFCCHVFFWCLSSVECWHVNWIRIIQICLLTSVRLRVMILVIVKH